MRRYLLAAAAAMAGIAAQSPAVARIHEQTENGFVIRQAVTVPASPEEAWAVLIKPSEWWDKGHSFSGDSANLTLDPRAGGCFCEVLPNKESPNAAPAGSAEHMRVIYVEVARALRMTGALGPMQADAVTGVLTIVLRPGDKGTQILWEYAVAGHLRSPAMAVATDAVLTGQILLLAARFGDDRESGWIGTEKGETADEPEADGDEAADPEAGTDDRVDEDGFDDLPESGGEDVAPQPGR